MKKIVLLSFLSLMSLVTGFSLSASAVSLPLRSLNDLPARWTGVAGDLFTRVESTLVIDKILDVKREDSHHSFTATYRVEAQMTVGAREFAVHQIVLRGESPYINIVEITLKTRDELVSDLFAIAKYDEVTHTFILRESPRLGVGRRFVLHGNAR